MKARKLIEMLRKNGFFGESFVQEVSDLAKEMNVTKDSSDQEIEALADAAGASVEDVLAILDLVDSGDGGEEEESEEGELEFEQEEKSKKKKK